MFFDTSRGSDAYFMASVNCGKNGGMGGGDVFITLHSAASHRIFILHFFPSLKETQKKVNKLDRLRSHIGLISTNSVCHTLIDVRRKSSFFPPKWIIIFSS